MRTLAAIAVAGALAAGPLAAQSGSSDRTRPLLDGVRGASPVQCEFAIQGLNGWWSNGPEPDRDPVGWAVVSSAHRKIDPASVPALAAALRDPDGCVRRVAARLLGRSRLPSAKTRLLEALRDQDPGLRRLGATGLGYMDDKSVTKDLVRALDDKDAGVRAAAAWAVGAIQ